MCRIGGGFRRRDLRMLEVVFQDASGARLIGKWFNATYQAKLFEPGVRVALYGKVEFDSYSHELSMMHPDYEVLRDDEGDGDD